MLNLFKKKSKMNSSFAKPAVLKKTKTLQKVRSFSGIPPSAGWFTYDSTNRHSLYRYIRDSIPLIRNAVETWVRILNTPSKIIFTGEEAKALGLVDRLGNLEDAIQWAGRLAGIEGKIDTVYAREKKFPYLEYILDNSLRKILYRTIESDLMAEYLYKP